MPGGPQVEGRPPGGLGGRLGGRSPRGEEQVLHCPDSDSPRLPAELGGQALVVPRVLGCTSF